MPTTIPTNTPLEAQILAAKLRDEEIPAEVANEASFTVGAGGIDVPAGVIVPDSAADRAREIIDEGLELPDDVEFVNEEGEEEAQFEPFSPLFKIAIVVAIISFVVLVASLVLIAKLEAAAAS